MTWARTENCPGIPLRLRRVQSMETADFSDFSILSKMRWEVRRSFGNRECR